jgi:hypothetical protein
VPLFSVVGLGSSLLRLAGWLLGFAVYMAAGFGWCPQDISCRIPLEVQPYVGLAVGAVPAGFAVGEQRAVLCSVLATSVTQRPRCV